MPTPRPTQISGRTFLAGRVTGLLADEPRVGKTGAAIMAADAIGAERILVITTSSGRGVWARAFDEWSCRLRSVGVIDGAAPAKLPDATIVGWGRIAGPSTNAALRSVRWSLVIIDESHFAKAFDAARTRALYGELVNGGSELDTLTAIASCSDRVWCLSGTPAPNSLFDLYPMLRALDPQRLKAFGDAPDVTRAQDFLKRYCIVKPKKISQWRWIDVIVGGRNEAELKARLDGFSLRRTQKDVGITSPVYETWPLLLDPAKAREIDSSVDAKAVLEAIADGTTAELEMHLGPLRRHTGSLKADLIVDAVREEFQCGLDKVVLAYWHRDVGDALMEGLAQFGAVRLDGQSTTAARAEAEQAFRDDAGVRVFLAQIQAAGEAIDLSAAALLVFVETSATPKDMAQMALRITNYTQNRQPVVRVAALAGSIDEPMQRLLLRKWAPIKEVTQ